MNIYVIRHSESVDDILNCYGGVADFELTEEGKNKVRNYKLEFGKLNVNKIYTSPYKRAFNTSKILNEDLNVDIEVVDDIREFNQYGVMSGVNKDLAKEIFSYFLNMEEYKDFGYYNNKMFYGGESVQEFDKRVKNAFDYIVSKSKDYDNIAVITHGGVYRSIFKNILSVDKKIIGIDDLATTVISYENGKYNLKSTKKVTFGDEI